MNAQLAVVTFKDLKNSNRSQLFQKVKLNIGTSIQKQTLLFLDLIDIPHFMRGMQLHTNIYFGVKQQRSRLAKALTRLDNSRNLILGFIK